MHHKGRVQWHIAWCKQSDLQNYNRQLITAFLFLYFFAGTLTMGARRSTRQGVVKTEYIQFETVLKSNFLLHEQISRKEEALNYSELQNVEYQEVIKELREALQENKEFMKGIIEDNN